MHKTIILYSAKMKLKISKTHMYSKIGNIVANRSLLFKLLAIVKTAVVDPAASNKRRG